MFGEAFVEDGVAVGFGGAVFESAGVGGEEEVGAVEEGFGALGEECRGGCGVGEWWWGEGCGLRWVGVGYFHCMWWWWCFEVKVGAHGSG